MSTIPFGDKEVLDIFKSILKDHPKTMRHEALVYMQSAVKLDMRCHTLHIQVLYVQNNLDNWRGEEARRVKNELRAYLKAHCNKGCFL